jgi:hypothetical protein
LSVYSCEFDSTAFGSARHGSVYVSGQRRMYSPAVFAPLTHSN